MIYSLYQCGDELILFVLMIKKHDKFAKGC